MSKNKKFRREMVALSQRLDNLSTHTVNSSDYIRGHDHAVSVINRVIKRELEATK